MLLKSSNGISIWSIAPDGRSVSKAAVVTAAVVVVIAVVILLQITTTSE